MERKWCVEEFGLTRGQRRKTKRDEERREREKRIEAKERR